MNYRKLMVLLLLAAVSVIVTIARKAEAAASNWGFELKNLPMYESNIYHSYDDTLETGALVNELDTKLEWRWRQSRQVHHRAKLYGNFELYPNYSNRNQRVIGLEYAPYWRYNKKGRLSLNFDISRRNKDLIDDAGQVLARTLQRWQFDASVRHDYKFGKFDSELSLLYNKDNYDEEPGLTSYDYHSVGGRARLSYDWSPRVKSRVTFDIERRNYDERRTYTVQYGAFVGRPYEIRKYTFKDIELSNTVQFYRNNEVSFDVDFGRRSENFENFYGYDHWQYRLSFDLHPAYKHQTKISFRIKNKRYDNYWNSSIGLNNRVWVDYSDFQIEHTYAVSERLNLIGYIRNYDKESNYQGADYTDLSTGIGLEFKW